MSDEAKELFIKALEKIIDSKPIPLCERMKQKKQLHKAKLIADTCETLILSLYPYYKNINLPIGLLNHTIDYIVSLEGLENEKINKIVKIIKAIEDAHYRKDNTKLIRLLNGLTSN